ncbi:MAG: hypothetical protein WC666_04375 [Candidatus Paceibacterota bacterium]|jgi:hypothetical protein
MRHTLLPLKERVSLRREYRVRALVVLLFMLSISCLIGIVALIPGFIRTYSEEVAVMNMVSSLKTEKDNAGLSSLENDFVLSKKLLSYFDNKGIPDFKTSAIINGIISIKDNLRLTSIAVTRGSTTTVSVVIQGVAPTRNSLLAFKTRFESAIPGNKVDLPVSQLSKSSNLQFSLKLTQQLK